MNDSLSTAAIPWESTGLYIAFPTTPELKPIYRGYKAKVNDQHTKIGIAEDSLRSRRGGYMATFDGEVEFIPLAVCAARELRSIEREWKQALLDLGYKRVGRTHEWFSTADREVVKEALVKILAQHANVPVPYPEKSAKV